MTNFYNKFIELCETKGVSPTKVAREIGIGTPNVTYWKNGSLPKADTALKLSDYFGVTVDYLLGTYTKEPGKKVPTDNPNDRYPYLLNKKLEGTITPEEAEELAALERLNKGTYVTDKDIMFALFNGSDGITDEMYEEVKRFAQFIKERESRPK